MPKRCCITIIRQMNTFITVRVAKRNTHTKQASEPRPRNDFRIYIKIDGKRRPGSIDKYVRGSFTRLCKGKGMV